MTLSSTPRVLAAAACAAWFSGVPLASTQAAESTATFFVTADVVSTCNITANNLNFGPYSGAEIDMTTTLTATCSNGVPYDVGLNAGLTGTSVTARKMTGPGTDLLAYSLSQDSAHSINWGDTVPTDTVHGVGAGVAQTLTVYGKLPGSQFVGPGDYSDEITVTLTF
jgi:spore coat protein U-like protein